MTLLCLAFAPPALAGDATRAPSAPAVAGEASPAPSTAAVARKASPARTSVKPRLIHFPRAEVPAERILAIHVQPELPVGLEHVFLHWRAVGDAAFTQVAFVRLPSGDFVAEIPAEAVQPPGLEYYLAGEAGPYAGPRFAAAETPHRLYVHGDSELRSQAEELSRYDGNRSRFSIGTEYVSFGLRSDNRPADWYWSGHIDFTYRILSTIRALRLGAVRLRGESLRGGEQSLPLEQESSGYDYGFAEVELQLSHNWGVKGEVQLGANGDTFTTGFFGTVRIGPAPGTHVELWGGGVGRVGAAGGLRLHWDTVPRVPMSAGIEVTSWPNGVLGGLRLVYEATVPVSDNLSLSPHLSYQARSARFGSVGGGVTAAYAF